MGKIKLETSLQFSIEVEDVLGVEYEGEERPEWLHGAMLHDWNKAQSRRFRNFTQDCNGKLADLLDESAEFIEGMEKCLVNKIAELDGIKIERNFIPSDYSISVEAELEFNDNVYFNLAEEDDEECILETEKFIDIRNDIEESMSEYIQNNLQIKQSFL